jgi:signal transduction histidine kinase
MNTGNATLILLAASGILYALLFASVASRLLKEHSRRHRIGGLLLAYLLLSFLWALGQLALALGQPSLLPRELLARLLHYALLPLSLLLLALTWQYLQPGAPWPGRRGHSSLPWYWWGLGLAWLAVVVALYEDLPAALARLFGRASDGLPAYSRQTHSYGQWLAFGGLVAGWAGFLAAAAVLTLQAHRRSPHRPQRRRIGYWALALACAFAAGLLFLAGAWGWGVLLNLMGGSAAAYLVLAQRLPGGSAAQALPGLRHLAREALSYLIVTLLRVTFLAAAFLLGHHALLAVPGYPPWPVALALALLLAAVVYPLLDRLHTLLAGPRPATRSDPGRILAEYSTLISNILDLDDLAIVALGLCREVMDVRRGVLYVVEGEQEAEPVRTGGKDYIPTEERDLVRLRALASTDQELPSHSERADETPRLSSDSPLVEYLRREQHPLTQYDLSLQPRFHSLPPDERRWLHDLAMDVYVPIRADRRWLGLLVLGPRRSGEPYSEEDLNLLGKLAIQTAVALQNARQFEALKTRNAKGQRRIEELAAARQALSRLDAGRSDMMHITAREMRQALTSIQGYVELVREFLRVGPLPREQGEELMKGIAGAVWRVAEMTQALHDAAQVDGTTAGEDVAGLVPSGGKDLVQALPLERAIEAAAAQWAEAWKQRDLTFSTRGLADLPSIMADGRQLQRAFAELLHNAIRSTPDGGQIQVRGYLRDGEQPEEEQSVEIVVADTGLGIAREDLARVFEPFFRRGEVVLHSGGRTRFKTAGPGLGLSQVRRIVEAHGGRIWADSPGYDEENCPGTEVHVVLPLRGNPLRAYPEPRGNKKPPRNAPPPINGFEEV